MDDGAPADDPALVRPALRGGIDHHPTTQDGRRGLVLVDRLGFLSGQAFVPEELLPILGRFDGTTPIERIERDLLDEHGFSLPEGFVRGIVRQLDEHLLLQGARFDAAVQAATRSFTDAGIRPAQHAGTAGYPRDLGRLQAALEKIVARAGRGAAGPADESTFEDARGAPRGLICPHIDLARGHEGYARGYGRLGRSRGPDGRPPADLFVVFGTGHQGPSAPLTGLTLDWQTPLGTTRTDRTFVEAVHETVGAPAPLDLLLHRDEHSIEFQVLFLQHLFGAGSFEVACFLTGSMPCAGAPGHPASEAWFQRAVDALRAAAGGRRVCWVAGADLAHVGPFFGDEDAVDEAELGRLERDERARLAALERGDPGGFFTAVEGPGNPDRVCGVAPIYWVGTLAGGRAELLHYGQAVAPDRSQVVSFCSAVYPGS